MLTIIIALAITLIWTIPMYMLMNTYLDLLYAKHGPIVGWWRSTVYLCLLYVWPISLPYFLLTGRYKAVK